MVTLPNVCRFLAGSAVVGAAALAVAYAGAWVDVKATRSIPRTVARAPGTTVRGVALRAAIQSGDVKAVAAALDHGASPNRPMPGLNGPAGGFTPLNAAVLTGNARVVRYLLRRGADTEFGDAWYPTPLVAAVTDDKPEMMRLLVAHGARVNDRRGGSRALWVAATMGDLDAMTFLLARGANRDSRAGGATLLHALQAQGLGGSDAARLLRLRGATE